MRAVVYSINTRVVTNAIEIEEGANWTPKQDEAYQFDTEHNIGEVLPE